MTISIGMPSCFKNTCKNHFYFNIGIWDDKRIIAEYQVHGRSGYSQTFLLWAKGQVDLSETDNISRIACLGSTPHSKDSVKRMDRTKKQRVMILGDVVGYQFNKHSNGRRTETTTVFGVSTFEIKAYGNPAWIKVGFVIWKDRVMSVIQKSSWQHWFTICEVG